MNGVVVVLGPTGTGKSKLAVEIAKAFGGEVLNADAFQVGEMDLRSS
jgi:tRNA dimethylallyltransferase